MKVAIVDYGAGNLPSVERALQKLGAETERAVRPEQIAYAKAVVLPGVGHFSAFVAGLHERNLTASLRMAHDSGIPILGICLGLQAMYESSEEAPGDPGLGFFSGEVRMLPQNVKAPHIGWNQVERRQPSQLLMGIPEDAYFYFAHSYAAPGTGTETAAVCNHGFPFAAVIEQKQSLRRAVSPRKIRRNGRARSEKFSGVRSQGRDMTLARRIIPCLDVDAGRVVKGIEFEGLRDMGDPAELAARYNLEGADELVVLDISATHQGRATFLDTIRRVAEQLNIPLTAGGGIRKLEDGRAVLRAGADKVTVNTAAVKRPELISELSQQFGAQAVVLSDRCQAHRPGHLGGLHARRPRRHGPRRREMGRRSGFARRRRNSAHLDRPRWHLQRLRLRSHRQDRRHRSGSGDRFGRRQHISTIFSTCSRKAPPTPRSPPPSSTAPRIRFPR